MQVIENVLNTPWPRQPMRILPDPPQTTLKTNKTLKFTTDSSINRNFHAAGGGAPWMLNKKMDEALIFTSTHATLYTTRPFPCISEIADLTVVERPVHDALFTGNSMLY